MRILIVEDEEHLAIGLKFNFEQEGYDVVAVNNGAAALRVFQDAETPFDVVILDLMLPGMSGYEICEQLRTISKDVGILVLSARTLSEDRTRAFDCGTDQYVTKPFELSELLSRVRNLAERRPRAPTASTENTYRFRNVCIDFRTFQATVGDQQYALTPIEMKLLRLFVRNEGTVLSRAAILEKVWGIRPAPATRTVDNFVMRLRKYFEIDPANPRHFLSVRGAGYRFLANPTDNDPNSQSQ